jgi:hypothetical protein
MTKLVSNALRVRDLATIPVFAVKLGMGVGLAYTHNPDMSEEGGGLNTLVDAINEQLSDDCENPHDINFIYEQCLRNNPYMHTATEQLLKTVLVESWGIVEVICESLFYGAAKDPHVAFPLKTKQEQKDAGVSFRSRGHGHSNRKKRQGIRGAFQNGFNSSPIDAALADPSLNASPLLRNLIVHKGSVVDKDFKDGIASAAPFLDRFCSLKEDLDKIEVDGALVKAVIDAVFTSCRNLIQAVDSWFEHNQIHSTP